MRERDFSSKVIKKLRAMGGLWRKQPASRFGASGVADIIGCVKGRYVEIELKAPGKYSDPCLGLSPLQVGHGLDVQDNGGIWICGDDWDAIIKELLSQAFRL